MTITNRVSLKSVNGGNTPIADVPDGAVVGSVTDAFDGTATVAATAAATGGTPTTFTITPTPTTSPATFTGTSPVTVSGLSDGTSYTFTAAGVNSTATGPAGSSSSSFTPVVAGSLYSIATVTGGAGGASSVTFSSIPSTYTHLQIRGITRNANADDSTGIRLNSDSGSNYARHFLRGNGTSATAAAASSVSAMEGPFTAYSGTTANAFTGVIIDILDYANTNKNTTIRALGGADLNGSGAINLVSGLWMNTAAVNTISIFAGSGNIVEYSTFALYGVIA